MMTGESPSGAATKAQEKSVLLTPKNAVRLAAVAVQQSLQSKQEESGQTEPAKMQLLDSAKKCPGGSTCRQSLEKVSEWVTRAERRSVRAPPMHITSCTLAGRNGTVHVSDAVSYVSCSSALADIHTARAALH